ncbi:MAG TPA: hypothetical protein VH062_23530 [Polyangiaceae bacterium]|jgi:hypothetical protein|nr:hypothetical protein [Polyangiaceae bacterium]
MAYDDDETPRSSMRSIPPIARPSLPPPPPAAPHPSSWIWAVGALGLACVIAVGAPHYALNNQRSYGAGAESEPMDPGPGVHTELVRDAPLHRMAEPVRADGHRAVALVPRSAVARMDGRAMVFVADRDLKLLVATPVELGATEGEEQRVLSGVSAGQLVVTEGVAMLQRQSPTH